MRRNAEGIGDAVKESEHCSHIYGLSNLFFLPANVAKLLHIVGACLVGSFGDQLDKIQQRLLTGRETSFIELAFDDGLNALISGSLNTQEVRVAVQSIWTPIQVRDMAGNHFFMPPRQVAFRKMDRV